MNANGSRPSTPAPMPPRGPGRQIAIVAGVWMTCALLVLTQVACEEKFVAEYTFASEAERLEGDSRAPSLLREIAPMVFRDDSLEFKWRISDYEVSVDVKNATSHETRLPWAGATFSGSENRAQPLIALADAFRPAPRLEETAIAPGARVRVSLAPQSHLVLNDGKWKRSRALFEPPGYRVTDSADEMAALARPAIGNSLVYRMIALEGGTEIAYEFRFRVVGVTGRGFRD